MYVERERERERRIEIFIRTLRFIAVYGMHVSAKRSIPLILKEAG